jgi:hypothetical protein
MKLNLDRVRENVRQATTEDLLDRATVYRQGMEPEALEIIDAELYRRGVGSAELAAHAELAGKRTLRAPEGWALKCHECHRPAVVRVWDWHRLWGWLPVFPRRFHLCEEHWASHPTAWRPQHAPGNGDA